MSGADTAPAEGQESPLRTIWRAIVDNLEKLHIVAVIVAGVFYQIDVEVTVIVLSLTLALLLWQLSREFSQRARRPVFISSVGRWVASLFTTNPRVLRAARISALVVFTAVITSWLSWTAIASALASSKMDGDINIVVARFHDVGGGENEASPVSTQLSLWLESSLRTEFPEAVGTSTLSVRLVDDVIAGNAEQAERQALSLGREHGANLVIYGDVLERSDADVLITPRFTFTGRESVALSAVDVAALVGDNALGEEIGPIDLSESQAALSGRSRVIVHFLAGLVGLLGDDPASVQRFEEARRLSDELGLRESATIHAFLGQAYLTLHTAEGYERAQSSFEQALALEPEDAGAHLGLANTRYLQARSGGDAALLLDALASYDRAVQSALAARAPIIPARAHLGRGNALLLLARESAGALEPEARREYQTVLDLAEACGGGGLSWWDPRGWGPWDSRFHDEPDYCPQLLQLAAVAETLLAGTAEVTRQSLVLSATDAPPVHATVAVDSATARVGEEATILVHALGLTRPGLGAWEMEVNFDLGILTVQDCSSQHLSACNKAFAPGKVRFAGASASGLVDDVSLVEIAFQCQREGEGLLDLAVDVLADATAGGPRAMEADVSGGRVTCGP